MIPKILHMIWVGEKEPAQYFWNNLNKWRKLMPHWSFMIWTNDMLSEDLIDRSYLNLIKQTHSGAQAADLLRWYVIYKWGGHYVDADVTPIKSLDEIDCKEHPIILCHDLPITCDYIASGYIAGCENHKLFQRLVQKMYHIDLTNTNIHLTTGPRSLGIEYGILNNEMDNNWHLMLPYWYFYRNRIGDPGPTVPNRITRDHPDAIGNHTYVGSWL